MKYENKIILASIGLGGLMWVLDAALDPELGRLPFSRVFIHGGSGHDLLMRSVILVSFIVFGFLISRVVARNIQAHKELGEKKVYLDNILRSATEYAIATTDRDLRITYYNPMAEKFHGYSAKEVIGRTVQEMHTKENVLQERFQKAMDEVRTKGEYTYTLSRETPDGKRLIEARISGIYDEAGVLVGYANFSRDITESKRAEEERERLIGELKVALASVETLKGLLPICSYCKKIRDDTGYWSQIETYIRKHSRAEFTHSICPECEKKAVEIFEKELSGR